MLAMSATATSWTDEAHNIARDDAARTKRLVRFMKARDADKKPVKFVGMSGTITGKHLTDYAHLARWALRDRCFLPSSNHEMSTWAAIVASFSSGANEHVA